MIRLVLLTLFFLSLPAKNYASPELQRGKTPKSMLDNVFAVSEVRAATMICFDSDISAKRALRFSILQTKLDAIVGSIGETFNDDNLYNAYLTFAHKLQNDKTYNNSFLSGYTGCSDTFLLDLYDWVEEAERTLIL